MGWSTPRAPEELPFPTRKIVDREIKDNLDYLKTNLGTGDVLADGTVPFTGTLDMGTNKIENVVDPTADQEAATKKYVDDNAGLSTATLTEPTRTKDTIYQNGSGVRFVTISVSLPDNANAMVIVGTSSPPGTVLQEILNQTGDAGPSIFAVSFIVPPSYYYRCSEIAGTITIVEWLEYALS